MYNLSFAVRTHIYGIWYIVGRGYHVRWYQYMAGVVWEAKFPLVFVIRKVHFEYQLNKAMLILTRTLIDDEFQEK
jgi:hypothetical protein